MNSLFFTNQKNGSKKYVHTSGDTMKTSRLSFFATLLALLVTLIPAASQAWEKSPSHAQSKAARGDALLASMEARRHFEGGRKLERERNLPEAIALYSKAASLAPDSAEVHFALGEALSKAQRNQDALVRYTLAVTIAPEHRKALFSRSQLCLRMNLNAQARKDLSRLIALEPKVASHYYQRATTLMKLNCVTEAYHDFLRAHELDKKYPRPKLLWENNSAAAKIA
jgi:tetratricopeptide (TPR) repeat protein